MRNRFFISYRFACMLFGLMLFLFGMHICMHGEYYDFRYGINISFGPAHFYAGIIFSVIGLVFLVFAVVKKTEDFEDPEDIILICPKCLEPFTEGKVPENKCSNCSVDLEELEGFYDRHPEIKETKT